MAAYVRIAAPQIATAFSRESKKSSRASGVFVAVPIVGAVLDGLGGSEDRPHRSRVDHGLV
jgi:hypothetical protein